MSVIVISRRVFRIDDKKKLIPYLKDLKNLAEKQEGFVSRSSYTNIKDKGECITVSEWKSVKQWKKWMERNKVKKIQWEIDSLIGEKTVFDVYKSEKF